MGPSINYVRTWGGGGGSSLLYISIAYYMQKVGEGVQIACKIAYVINLRQYVDIFLRVSKSLQKIASNSF